MRVGHCVIRKAMHGASKPLLDGLVMVHVDVFDLGVVLLVMHGHKGRRSVGKSGNAGLGVNEGVWDGAVRLQCLHAAMHRCNIVTLSAG